LKILWAMDLIGGQAVRLAKGDFEQKTIYSDNPPEMIEKMRRDGARDFHIIDLDGARTGSRVHAELIRTLRTKIDGYLEVGGGIRTEEEIASYTKAGINGIIVGTRALTDPAFFDGLVRFSNIVLGLDMLDGKIMVKGWQEAAPIDTGEVLEKAQRVGVKTLLCTNIARDGMLTGPDFEGLGRMLQMTKIPLIASGGLSSVDDLKRLKEMSVWAAIVGKAFYEGKVGIPEAMVYAD
jgi:phosphoribosylformimino-5-aminoimidazole carboxamide ribotide isomerase